jgi:hypothetical protein
MFLRSLTACLTLLLVSLGASACHHKKPPEAPKLCFSERSKAEAARPLRGNDWIKLAVKPVIERGIVYAKQDCTGREIRWQPPPASCIVKSPPLLNPAPAPLNEESVFERMLPGERRLVWVVTHRFTNGEGFGPVLLARILPTGLEAEAIGELRMRTERVQLELWTIQGNQVVVAGGETCVKPSDPSTCQRAQSVLVLYQKTLAHPVLTYQDGRCIDEPWVELKRQEDLPLDSGWSRHFEITSSVSHDQRYLVITEQVVVQDADPNAPDLPPREVRRIDTDRFIHVEGPRLITRQHPLWPRILPSVGSTELLDPQKM